MPLHQYPIDHLVEVSKETVGDAVHTRWRCSICGFEDVDRAGDFPDRIFHFHHESAPLPTEGPGTELQKLIKELGFDESLGCGCAAEVARMNALGPKRCREQIDSIVATLEENAKLQGWWALAKAGAKAATMRIFSVRCLVEKAITAAEHP